MNSEAQLQILTSQTEEHRLKKEAEEAKEAKIADEASDAMGFESHPFWKMMSRDLTEIREKLINTVMTNETLSKYQIDRYRLEAKNIKSFIEHPKLYVKRLQDLLTRKRNIRGQKGNTNG